MYIGPTINASGITFGQWGAKGFSGHVEALISANMTATSAPVTAPTVSAAGISTGGGSLAAGVWMVKITESNGFGETTASPESAAMTVAAGDIPKITFPALQSGNTYRNVYGTPGASGTEVLYATGVTTATYAMAAAAPSNSYATPPPTATTTGLTWVDASGNTLNIPLMLLRSVKDGNFESVAQFAAREIGNFNAGEPLPGNAVVAKIRHAHVVFAMLAQLCQEAGTLADANAGTIGNTTNGIGNSKLHRTWP